MGICLLRETATFPKDYAPPSPGEPAARPSSSFGTAEGNCRATAVITEDDGQAPLPVPPDFVTARRYGRTRRPMPVCTRHWRGGWSGGGARQPRHDTMTMAVRAEIPT